MQISTANISQILSDGKNAVFANKYKVAYGLSNNYIWPWSILKFKIKVMHISIVNVLQMVADLANVAIGNK